MKTQVHAASCVFCVGAAMLMWSCLQVSSQQHVQYNTESSEREKSSVSVHVRTVVGMLADESATHYIYICIHYIYIYI